MLKLLPAALICLLPSGASFAQELTEVPLCDVFTNPGLPGMIKKGRIDKLNVFDAGPGSYAASAGLASSFLKPSGKGPRKPADTPPADYGQLAKWEEAAVKYEQHTCRYAPKRAFDQDTKTAWCEGAKGNGENEILMVPLWARGANRIEIWAGYGKSKEIFEANGRPKKVRVYLLSADEFKVHQYGDLLTGIKVVARREVTLEDKTGYQAIDFPGVPADRKAFRLAAVQILSVYPGKRYPDTCISEIIAAR